MKTSNAYDAISCEDDEDDKDDARKLKYHFKFADLSLAAFSDEYAWFGWIIYVVPQDEQKGLTSYQSASLTNRGWMQCRDWYDNRVCFNRQESLVVVHGSVLLD